MDRRNKNKITVLICVLSIMIAMCNTRPDKILENIIDGTYIATDGGEMILNNDHSFIGKQIDFSRIYQGDEFKGKVIDFSGIWTIEKNYQGNRILVVGRDTYVQKGINHMYLDEGVTASGKVSLSIEIGKNEIFIWQGDPDDDKRYSFIKQL